MDFILTVAQTLWFIWPAYCANAFPVVMRGKKPLDQGKYLGRNRILGDNKTIEGTIGGVAFGTLVGYIQILVQGSIPQEYGLAILSLPLAFMLSLGALAGDIIGSFIKRRLGIKPGDPIVLLDQLDFLLVALLFGSAFYLPAPGAVLLLVIMTPLIHIATNIIGYMMRLKSKPW